MKRSTRKILSFIVPFVAIFVIVSVAYFAYNKYKNNGEDIASDNYLEALVSKPTVSNVENNTKNIEYASYSEEKKEIIDKLNRLDSDQKENFKEKDEVLKELDEINSAQEAANISKPSKEKLLNRLNEINSK